MVADRHISERRDRRDPHGSARSRVRDRRRSRSTSTSGRRWPRCAHAVADGRDRRAARRHRRPDHQHGAAPGAVLGRPRRRRRRPRDRPSRGVAARPARRPLRLTSVSRSTGGRRRIGRARRGRGSTLDVDETRRRAAARRPRLPCRWPISSTQPSAGRAASRRRSATIARIASRPSAPANSAPCGSHSRTIGSTLGIVVGDVRRVGDDQVERAAQRRRAARRTTSPDANRTLHRAPARARRGWPGPRRARRPTRRSATPSCRRAAARPPATGRSRRCRCRGRRTRSAAPASSARRCERQLDHLLGLGPRDQHPPIDHQVEVAERPPPEHVLQRLAGAARARPSRRGGAPSARSPARRARRGTRRRRSRWPPRTSSARWLRPPTSGVGLGPQLAPGDGAVVGRSCRSSRSVAGGELAGPLVGDQRVDDVVEVAGQHVLRAGRW